MNPGLKKNSFEDIMKMKPVRTMDTRAVMAVIPQRYPFLLVDMVDVMDEGKFGVGTKCVTVNELYFEGHFPGNPIMPGVLILEALAQAASAMFLSAPLYEGKNAYFLGIDKAKFRNAVRPGHTLKLAISVSRATGKAGKCRGAAFVEGQLCAEAEMTFAIVKK